MVFPFSWRLSKTRTVCYSSPSEATSCCHFLQSPLFATLSQFDATLCGHFHELVPFATFSHPRPLRVAIFFNLYHLLLFPIRGHLVLPRSSIFTICYFLQIRHYFLWPLSWTRTICHCFPSGEVFSPPTPASQSFPPPASPGLHCPAPAAVF